MKTIAHHQQTSAQPVPELQFLTANLPPGLLLSMASYGLGYPLSLLSWLRPLPTPCAAQAHALVGQCEEQKRPWFIASTAQQ